MKRKFLVTGGAGFIGSHLVDALVQKGAQVTVADNLSKGKAENINKKADFIKVDIRSEEFGNLLKKLKPEIIFHLAAQSSLSASLLDPKEDLDINLMATQNILDLAVKNKAKKIVFASSAAVYKESLKLPLYEDDPKEPVSFYGVSKLCSEFLLQNYFKRYRLPYVSLRFSNVYGPRQDSTSEGGVVAIFAQKILRGEKATINMDGNQTRDFIYVSDIVAACLLSVEEHLMGEFNIATGKQTSVNNLYRKLLEISKAEERSVHLMNNQKEVKNNSLSPVKLEKVTGWKPKVALGKGLGLTLEYFKNQ